MAALGSLLSVVLPRGKTGAGKVVTPTYVPDSSDRILTFPTYRDHLTDLFDNRINKTSVELMQDLFVQDPDTSAAVAAYLTVADTEPMIMIRDAQGQIDADAFPILQQLMLRMSRRVDYTQGFQIRSSIREMAEAMRHMILLRGVIGNELIVDKQMVPSEFRHVDMASVRWYERQPGLYKPVQMSGSTEISLDLPTFYVSWFRRSPRKVYADCPFVSAINTIAARTQVINDLYRIMNITGYPRMDISVVEEVLRKSAPPALRTDEAKMREHIAAQVASIRSAVSAIKPSDAFVHTDAVEAKVINDKNSGIAINVEAIIKVLNSQNQAGLKSVATVLGRGESGVNTATVEARVFSLSADAINKPVAEQLGNLLTMALQLLGRQSFVEVNFRPAELRPWTELEPMLMVKQTRLLDLLSFGVITDEEFHIQMFGRPPPKDAPVLSGTNFRQPVETGANVDTDSISPNSDPLGRSVSPAGTEAAKSNGVKSGG